MPRFNNTDVFISHSSKDARYAEEVTGYLSEVIDFSGGKVVCTSVVGFGMEFGTQFERHLHEAIEAADVLIPLISPNSLASLFCTFEMGAAWGLGTTLKPVLLPGFPARKLARPLSSLHYLKWTDQLGWIALAREVAKSTRSKVQVPAEQVAASARKIARFR